MISLCILYNAPLKHFVTYVCERCCTNKIPNKSYVMTLHMYSRSRPNSLLLANLHLDVKAVLLS